MIENDELLKMLKTARELLASIEENSVEAETYKKIFDSISYIDLVRFDLNKPKEEPPLLDSEKRKMNSFVDCLLDFYGRRGVVVNKENIIEAAKNLAKITKFEGDKEEAALRVFSLLNKTAKRKGYNNNNSEDTSLTENSINAV